VEFVVWDSDTGRFDPGPYLARLIDIAPLLPPGAAAFATEAAHYDYYAFRVADDVAPGRAYCTKDLHLLGWSATNTTDGMVVTARFAFPGPRRNGGSESDLVVTYDSVIAFAVDATDPRNGVLLGSSRLGRWMIDETVAAPSGAIHRIAFENGYLTMTCADLSAEWA
jgi:hypothetical protein